jgi:hypothetical protein
MHLLFTAAALLGLAGASNAQYSQDRLDPTPYGYSFRLGVLFPSDDTLSNLGDNWLGVGIDYAFTKQFFKGSTTYFSLDYIVRGFEGDKGSYWPLLVNQRFYGENVGEQRMYALVGFGAVIFDLNQHDAVFGGRLGVGYELGQHIFVEASHFVSETAKGGVRASSTGIYLGYRF